MIREALRRLRSVYFRRAATSVSPPIEPERDPNGYAISLRPGLFGYTATIEYVGLPWSAPASLLAPFSPASDPPKAPATIGGPNVTPWAEWQNRIDNHYATPGWTFCKFGLRGPGPDESAEVWGIVRNGYGAYWCRFFVHALAEDWRGEAPLAVIVNARSGYAFGIFANMEIAVQAAEIAMRMSMQDALVLNPDDPASTSGFAVLTQALNTAGYFPGHIFCRPMKGAEIVPGNPIPVWVAIPQHLPEEVKPS